MALRVRLGAARIRAPHTDHLGAATAPNIALLGRGGPELMSSESIRLFALTSFSCKPHVERRPLFRHINLGTAAASNNLSQ